MTKGTPFIMTQEQAALLAGSGLLLLLVFHEPIFRLLSYLGRLRLPALRVGKDSPGIRVGQLSILDSSRVRQMHIVGATGVGKSTFIEHLILGDIERGYGAIIIDAKGDRSLYERVREICDRVGRTADLHLLSPNYLDESSRWNPFRLGTAAELQAKVFNAQQWSEPFYEKACEAALIRAFNELVEEYPAGFTVRELTEKLQALARKGLIPDTSGSKDSKTEGLFYDLYSMTEGPWAEILGAVPPQKTRRELNFLDVVRKSEIVFVDLPTESQAVQSRRIGKILLQEIVLISGLRKQYPALKTDRPFSVIIDEFDAFATEQFATFLNKGRSSDFMITMAHQTLGDLRKVSQEFTEQVIGNPNIHVVFRTDSPNDAEFWSRFFGTERSVKTTYQSQDGARTGVESNRESQEFRFHPDMIKELGTGECIVSVKTQKLLQKFRVPLPRLPALRLPVLRPEAVASETDARGEEEVRQEMVSDLLVKRELERGQS